MKRERSVYSRASSEDSKIDNFDKQIESAVWRILISHLARLLRLNKYFVEIFVDYTTKGSDTNDDDDSTCCYTLAACGGANLF